MCVCKCTDRQIEVSGTLSKKVLVGTAAERSAIPNSSWASVSSCLGAFLWALVILVGSVLWSTMWVTDGYVLGCLSEVFPLET